MTSFATPHTERQDRFSQAAAWWRRLQPGGRREGARGDRAALARLRRATLPEAMTDPATIELFRLLGERRAEALPEVALCAAVLAHVREDLPNRSPGAMLGAKSGADRPLMSPIRFQRLIRAAAPEERLVQFRRAVALAGGRMNVREMAAACLDWSSRRRRQWVLDYFDYFFAPGSSAAAGRETAGDAEPPPGTEDSDR